MRGIILIKNNHQNGPIISAGRLICIYLWSNYKHSGRSQPLRSRRLAVLVMQLEPGAQTGGAGVRVKYLTIMLVIFIRIFVILSFPSKIKLEAYFNTLDSSPFLRNKVLMKSLCAGLTFSPSGYSPPPFPGLAASQPRFHTLSPWKLVGRQPGPPPTAPVQAAPAGARGGTRTRLEAGEENART